MDETLGRMSNTIETSSSLLIRTAQVDARKNVSKWRWVILGICMSCLSTIKVFSLCVAIVCIYLFTPHINLSTPERIRIYSKHPALYTQQYRKTVHKLQFTSLLWGWIIGIIFLIPF